MTDQESSRRLTTILASDVVGYSLMTARNEEHALLSVRRRFATVSNLVVEHHGRVFNTAGDSLLAEFPSPVEAVRCALEVQGAMKAANGVSEEADRVQLRIGINLGDVMAAGTDLLGDGVNVAARLEGLAAPGGVCVSASVYEQVRGKLILEAEDLGERQVKNIPRPIRAYNLVPGRISVTGGTTSRAPFRWKPASVAGLAGAVAIAGAGVYLLRDKATIPEPPAKALVAEAPANAPAAVAPPALAVAAPGGGSATSPALATVAAAPPRPPSGASRPLVPEEIPFIDDRWRESVRTRYLPALDNKALALSYMGHHAIATHRIDDDAARKDALAGCNESVRRDTPKPNADQQCFVYAVGNTVTWTKRPPVMPPQPWVLAVRSPATTLSEPSNIPLATVSKGLIDRYVAGPASKALALGHGGKHHVVWNRSSESAAMRAALQACGYVTQRACLIYALNNEIVQRAPEVMRAVDILAPKDLPGLTDGDRQRIDASYMAGGDWRALAVGRNGRIGIAVRHASEEAAIDAAVRECEKSTGLDCAVVAVGPFTVARR